MVFLLQRNPSTLKLHRNPETGKLMRAGPFEEPPEQPCDYCTGVPPANCQITIAGVEDCICKDYYYQAGYKINPLIAAIINDVHVLDLVDGIGVCKYEKIIEGSWDLEYWTGIPEDVCQELDTIICTFTEIKLQLLISTNLYFSIFTSSCEPVYWPGVKYFFWDVLPIVGTPPCTSLDSIFVNENDCNIMMRGGHLQFCEGGEAGFLI